MGKLQNQILTAVREFVEKIETERYNAQDPVIVINKNDPQEEVIIKILTSERTGATIKIANELLNTTSDLAKRNFNNGVRTLNSWQFKKSEEYFSEAANLEREPLWQQRINFFKQLQLLLESTIKTAPERIIKSKGGFFEEVTSFLSKYDLFTSEEHKHYQIAIRNLYDTALQLEQGDQLTLSQQLFIRCTISLYNNEYLAAYIWLYKIYLINKESFDTIAQKDKQLQNVLNTLQLYIEVEIGIKQIEEIPTIASAYDLQTIFTDYLTTIFDVNFAKATKEKFSFPIFRDTE